MTEDGSYVTRYVYDESSVRISAEFDYADGTQRGEAGENLQSDFATERGKVWYRWSLLGSTLFAVDANGEVVAHMVHDSWGAPLTETYPDTNFSGFENTNNYTGYTYDETLDLYFAQNRFYAADLHRFTQEDSVKDGNNWYAYCGSNPRNSTDAWGLAYFQLYELAKSYGATVEWQSANEKHGARAKVTLNHVTRYYTATQIDNDHAYLGGDNRMYVDDREFGKQWNYIYNKPLEAANAGVIYDEDGYIRRQEGEGVRDMRYGVTTMSDVGCELVAIYNALNKMGYHTTLSDIAQYYETHEGMWLNGLWGTKYWHIGDYFENIACLEVTKYENRGDSDGFRQEIEQVFRNLDTDSAIIISVINPNKSGIFKGVINGIHTFTAVKMDNGLIRFYNSYSTNSFPYLEKISLDQFLNEQGIQTILSAYLIERKVK